MQVFFGGGTTKRKRYIFDIPKIHKIGVYAIRNNATGKYYIGSSVDISQRMKVHAQKINRDGGINKGMAVDIGGYKNFKNIEFLALETFEDGEITETELREKEIYYIELFDSAKNGYNVNSVWNTGKYKEDEKLICPKEKYDVENLMLRFPKGTRERLKRIAKTKGISVNAYMVEEIKNRSK